MSSPSSERRDALLAQATAWVLEHGFHGLSLRPMAQALGTSARMLVYHFGSKDALVAQILEQIAARWMVAMEDHMAQSDDVLEALRGLWTGVLRQPASRAVHAVALEAWALGISGRAPVFEPFVAQVSQEWVVLVERGLAADPAHKTHASRRALLLVAAVEGLLLYHVTDERFDVDGAFEELLGLFGARNAPPA